MLFKELILRTLRNGKDRSDTLRLLCIHSELKYKSVVAEKTDLKKG